MYIKHIIPRKQFSKGHSKPYRLTKEQAKKNVAKAISKGVRLVKQG